MLNQEEDSKEKCTDLKVSDAGPDLLPSLSPDKPMKKRMVSNLQDLPSWLDMMSAWSFAQKATLSKKDVQDSMETIGHVMDVETNSKLIQVSNSTHAQTQAMPLWTGAEIAQLEQLKTSESNNHLDKS